MRLTIPGQPIQKPSIRSRRWKDWRRWADGVQLAAVAEGWRGLLEEPPALLVVEAYFAIPRSWTLSRRALAASKLHLSKPDANHIVNAVADALWARDERIPAMLPIKRWDDGLGPRVEIRTLDDFPARLVGDELVRVIVAGGAL